jgi:hypothetical protein
MQGTFITLPKPSVDVGMIEAFPTQQCSDFSRNSACLILLQETKFIGSSILPPGLFFRTPLDPPERVLPGTRCLPLMELQSPYGLLPFHQYP